MPDFDVTIVYEGNIETGYSRSNASGINEQDGMVVTLGNWLNGRLSCEQIEQLWCDLIIPKQNKEQKESEFFTAATAITGIPSSLSATLHSF